jgi:hypothetical protein
VTPPAVRVLSPRQSKGGSWDIVTSAPALTYPYLTLLRPSVNRAYLGAQANAGLLYSTKDGGSSWDHIECLHCVDSSSA